MKIFNIDIPQNNPLTNYEIWKYVRELNIPHFRTVCMLNALSPKVELVECGIVNLNSTGEKGSHWVAYWKKRNVRVYFDSYGQITPVEIQKYLKTRREFFTNQNVIQRNTDIVQPINSSICGHLCLFVLKALNEGWSYEKILNVLRVKKSTYTR